jgi:hypothetical protein
MLFYHCIFTPSGSTTGLHHDYHDNLYVLLRGCKRFRLFPPSTAPDMYVTGSIKKIYPNGRIVYAGQGDVNADGSGEFAAFCLPPGVASCVNL